MLLVVSLLLIVDVPFLSWTHPCQEVTCNVNAKRLLNVRRNEVIVTVPAARAYRFGCLRRKLGQALHSTDVCLLLCCRKSRPWGVSKEL